MFVLMESTRGAEIRIEPAPCTADKLEAGKLHVVARDAPLSDVMRRLADALGFELQFDGRGDSLVNIDASMPAPQLVAKLSPGDSTIVSQSPDPHCPGRYRIVKVWVLGKTTDGKARSTVRAETSQEKARRLDEMSRQAREQYENYVRAHGKAPPGVEEEAAKPK
jgi:hypothetical protein